MKDCNECNSEFRCSKCNTKLCISSSKRLLRCNAKGHYHYDDNYVCVNCWIDGRFMKQNFVLFHISIMLFDY